MVNAKSSLLSINYFLLTNQEDLYSSFCNYHYETFDDFFGMIGSYLPGPTIELVLVDVSDYYYSGDLADILLLFYAKYAFTYDMFIF